MFSSFMLNAWIAATLVAFIAGITGYFVVQRNASFAAHALPAGIFPGAAAATLLGIDPFWGLLAFALLGAGGIMLLSRHQRNDVATALTLITLLGLGTLFLSLSAQYAQSVYALLFGEILGISANNIAPIALLALLTTTLLISFFRPLLLTSISEELSSLQGIHAGRINVFFLVILALTTAIALPIVGALLVFSLMLGPAAAARSLTAHPITAMALSAGLALLIAWAAIALSYLTNWPIGFFVGTLAAFAYLIGRIRKKAELF